jgi:hypothetical protein
MLTIPEHIREAELHVCRCTVGQEAAFKIMGQIPACELQRRGTDVDAYDP